MKNIAKLTGKLRAGAAVGAAIVVTTDVMASMKNGEPISIIGTAIKTAIGAWAGDFIEQVITKK